MQKAAAKISMISNKFDKEKKFKERVAEPIKEKINTLKDTICGTVIKAEHNVKTSKTYTKGKEKIGSIIESAKSAKNSIINKLKKKMMNKIKKDEQAIEKYEKENPKKEKAKRTSKKEINEKYNKYTKSGILSSSGLEVAE